MSCGYTRNMDQSEIPFSKGLTKMNHSLARGSLITHLLGPYSPTIL